jgi:hypothetical protein
MKLVLESVAEVNRIDDCPIERKISEDERVIDYLSTAGRKDLIPGKYVPQVKLPPECYVI